MYFGIQKKNSKILKVNMKLEQTDKKCISTFYLSVKVTHLLNTESRLRKILFEIAQNIYMKTF